MALRCVVFAGQYMVLLWTGKPVWRRAGIMTEQNTQAPTAARSTLRLPDRWAMGALFIAAMVLGGPILAILWMAFNPAENIWPHLMATTLPRYLANTLMLCLGGVGGVLSASVGTGGAAWLVTMYRFPGSQILQWLLLFPLAIPAYVGGAYALVDFLEYAGPVQTAMRDLFGWQNARDYWFPEIRSLGAAIVVLAAALNPPYVSCWHGRRFANNPGPPSRLPAPWARAPPSPGSGAWACRWHDPRSRQGGLPLR